MAIALADSQATQATGNSNSIANATGLTPSGSDRYGLVKVAWFSNVSVSSVMWGATDIIANQIKLAAHDGSSRKWLGWYYILDPAASSTTITVNFSGNTIDRFIIVEAWSGVDQVTPYSNFTNTADNTGGGAGTKEITVSSGSGSVVTDSFYMWAGDGGTETCTPDGSQTSIKELEGSSSNGAVFGASYEAGAASVAMTWTTSAVSSNWAMYGASLNAAAGGAAETYSGRGVGRGIGRGILR